jgi:phosphoribosylamine--glycine ligase
MAACQEIGIRAQEWGHQVRYWHPDVVPGTASDVGKGLLPRVDDWEKSMKWADLILPTDNALFQGRIKRYFDEGYPIFGCNPASARLELDRNYGQEMLKKLGIPTLPYQEFDNYDEAIAYVKQTGKAYAVKPRGDADKALSFVAKSAKGLVFKLGRWKEEGKVGKNVEFVLQKAVKGIEMAVGGWFGPGGWSRWKCENFEEKKFMSGGLGVNTGEQGTILRYVQESQLFEQVLEPLTQILHALDYVGYVDMNCIIDPKTGIPWPLEFTMRFGWPLIYIQSALHRGDPVEWMADMLEGRDTLKVSEAISVGIVLSHGDYPNKAHTVKENSGYPLYGTEKNRDSIWFTDVAMGEAPDDDLQMVKMPVTAGNLLAVTTGTGETVEAARTKAYAVIEGIESPTNLQYRDDIGERLKKQLPELHQWGFAKGMRYG